MTKGEKRPFGGRLLPGLLFGLLVVGAYADPLFLSRNFAGRDLLPYHLPVEKAVHDAYARGRLPVWVSEISGGRPLLPNPNIGSLYPVRPLLAWLPFPLAFRIYPVLHWIAGGIGMILLTRALGASASGAWVAAVSYVFSGVGVSEVFFTNIQPGMTLLPWVVWATVRRGRPGGLVLLSLFFALDLLAGDVFTIGLAIAAALLWILLETPREGRGRSILGLAGALALAALAALPQIAASALWAPYTRRAVVGMKLDEAFTFSLSPWRLLELVIPYPFGATWSLEGGEIWGRAVFRNFFATLYCGSFAAIAAVALRRGRARGARLSRALFLVTLPLSVLPSLAPAAWGEWPAPLPLRYPEKLSVGLVFALALASGLALDGFRQAGRPTRGLLGAGAALTAMAAAATLFPQRTGALAAAALGAPAASGVEAARQIPPALAEAGLFWMATVVALELLRLRRPVALGAALFLLTLVPLLANRRVARTFSEEAIFSPTPFTRSLARRDPRLQGRVLDESPYRPASPLLARAEGADPAGIDFYRRSFFFYTPLLWSRATVFNADPDVGDLSRMESLREISAFLASSAAGENLFSSLSLRFGIRFRDQTPLPGFRPYGGDGQERWDENPSALPPIRLARRCREEPGPVAALRALPRLSPGEIVIETGRRGAEASGGGVLRVLEDTPEHVRLATAAADPSWLFLLRGFWPYRTVLLDDKPVAVFPAQLAFSAIPIPAGRHRVDWRERVPGGEASKFGPLLFLLAAALILARDRRRVRQEEGRA